ncbi:MAG: hypothetical protein JW751_30635 [Polyangiaceae bacterium]|nr:hypothetical protein [Polyangiaceae bacterium]
MAIFADLLGTLRNRELEEQIAADLQVMMEEATVLVVEGGAYYWGKAMSPEDRLRLYGKAEVVADTHRAIRNLLVVHSPLPTSTDRAHFLGMVNLIREVERLVERAKNLVEMARLVPAPLPDDDVVREFRQIRRGIEAQLHDVPEAVKHNDVRRAQAVEEGGREAIARLGLVTERVSVGRYEAGVAIKIGLGAHTYSRIQRQLMNIVSSLVTPIHLVDFYEERSAVDNEPPSVR